MPASFAAVRNGALPPYSYGGSCCATLCAQLGRTQARPTTGPSEPALKGVAMDARRETATAPSAPEDDTELTQQVATVQRAAQAVRTSVGQVIVGKASTVDLLLIAVLCEGHVLIEDVPGLGKTIMAKALARSLGVSFARIQGTADLLPSDVTGVSYFS